ncbi:sulfonate transport system permease protein [Nocardioides scoriae]|uniref:Sulfonate transport system permease protein n=1 Tax=Nocardioides scoriae TaxID=642780 RepID=A0A1H1N442_9ACTN|nr:ABC transporter permease [Nocardioides scoriae]SDR93687.1 sulfonate transport system permease protein [Nocardioides scoriae]
MSSTASPVDATGVPAAAGVAATPSGRRPRRPRRGSAALRRAVSPLVLLALWQLASATGVLPEDKLAPPLQIFEAMAEEWRKGTLQDATAISLQRVAIGFVLGAAIALALAAVAGLSRIGDDAIDPPMQMLRTVPHFGLLPLLVLWLGIDESPKIALIALGVAFPLYVNTVAGIRGVDPKMIDAARALRLSWTERIRHVVAPGALPSALVGLRLSLGVAWLSLIVAEQINATSGIGYLVSDAASFGRTDVVVGGLVVYSLLGLATDSLVRSIERKALAWRHG